MPSNQTPNYKLNQWSKSDRVQMEDFNADNAKIDAAIKAEATARASAVSTLNNKIAKCGNCKIVYQTYVGDGTYGPDHPKVFTFPSKPLLLILATDKSVAVTTYGSKEFIKIDNASLWTYSITWGQNSFTMMSVNSAGYQYNQLNIQYTVIAFLATD